MQALTEQLVALREEAARREAERGSLEHAMEALRKVQLLLVLRRRWEVWRAPTFDRNAVTYLKNLHCQAFKPYVQVITKLLFRKLMVMYMYMYFAFPII